MKSIDLHPTREASYAGDLDISTGPRGFMPMWAAMVLLLSWGVAAMVAILGFGAWIMADWPHLAASVVPGLILTAVFGVVLVVSKGKQAGWTASTALVQAQRDKDERLGVAGELCDALRLRLLQDVEARERVCRVEARLWCLVEDETRVTLSMGDRPPDQLEAETETRAALTAEIDRITADISALHAAVVSPSREVSALDWLEAEVELAQPARPRRLQSSGA